MLPNENSNLSESFVNALTNSQANLRGYCQAALGGREEAQEALQRTNITLWRKAKDWDPETEFLRWAIRVAKFEVLGVIRDRARRGERFLFDTDVVEAMLEEAEDLSITGQAADRLAALHFCLEKLIPNHRALLSRYYLRGHSIEELAEFDGRSLSAVKVLLLRLRRGLRRCIEGQLAKGGVS